MANGRLVRVVAGIVEEIAAHFADFAELLIGVASERLKLPRVNEGVVVIHIVFVVGIRVKRCTEGEVLEYRFHCKPAVSALAKGRQ